MCKRNQSGPLTVAGGPGIWHGGGSLAKNALGDWDAARIALALSVLSVNEPRGRMEEWKLTLARTGLDWHFVERRPLGALEGLIHLSLDPAGYRAQGQVLRLPDFELRFESGTLFTSPPSLGPTLLVFIGKGRVRFSPRPATERQQLEQFAGVEELDEPVDRAFVRLHPADRGDVMSETRLSLDPSAERRLSEADDLFEDRRSCRTCSIWRSLPRHGGCYRPWATRW